MPLVVTEEGSGRSKSRGSATSSSSGSFQNNLKVLRRSRTLDEDNTLERPKQTQRYGSQSLDELIRCAICLEQLCRPTMLPCQHTFCLICLDRYVEKKSNVITCPTCRLQVKVPIDGIRGLPTNILLQAFLESLKTDSATKKPSVNPGNQTACARCSNSAGNEVVTCEHCSELFCKSCHLLHSARLKKSWSKVIDNLFAENQRLSMIKEESEARSKKLSDKIQATVAIQVQQLYEKQDRLLSELKRWRSVEADRLVQVQQLCEELLSATPTIGSSEEEPVPNADVLKRSEAILERARLCGTTRLMFDSEELTLTCQSTETETETVPAASVTSAVHHAPVANNEHPTRRSSSTRRNNRRVTFSGAGDPHLPSFPLESSLSLSTDTKKPAELQSEADEKSIHYRSLSSHPRQRITSSVLQRPAGVAVSPWTGEIYVAATDSHRVYVIDKNGKIAKSLGSPYRSNERLGGGTSVTNSSLAHAATTNANYGTFLCPFGIAFSAVTEEIYVTDKWLNCIQVFNREGGYVRQIGVKGTSPGHFRSPEGIAVDPKGLIYVCDTCNDRVQVLDRNGVYIRELGAVSQMTLSDGKLYQKREFSEPSGVAVSPDGSVVAVVDSGNCRIKVFNPTNGELIVVFGFRGTQRGQFQQPECLAVDDKGFILVGDNGNGRIQIFRPNGSFVRALGSKGGGPGQFNWISGLTLSKDMDIISTDFKNHCIQIF